MRSLIAVFCLITSIVSAQTAKIHQFEITKGATINLLDETTDWEIHVQHLEAPKPGLKGLRAELAAKKMDIMKRYPQGAGSEKSAAGPQPFLGNNFEGNSFQGVPNDNDMAISNDSIIVSATNSKIHIYNAVTGDQLLARSLGLISNPLDLSGNKFDPKVIYDPNNDRFILIFLNGFTWQTSYIVVAFSQTNDPTGDWNLYALPGNPLDNETWSDYPVVGISGKDLFIGINTFTNGSSNNSGFTETCLWQVGLRQGYQGFDLVTRYYSDILPGTKEIFNITPIPAADYSDAENMFLLSNRNTDMQNDTLFLMEVTGRVTDPSTELIVRTVEADQPYILPVPAKQAANQWFDTNDSRVLGGYTHNNRLHFVQSCTDAGTGTSAIYYGVIDGHEGVNPTVTSRIYSDADLFYGYPNISWSGLNAGDEQSIITFNHSSFTTFAGFSAIHINEQLQASDRVEIKSGLALVNVLADTLERWGDYSGSQRLYDEPGVVWSVGSFGTQSNGHGTWLAQLTTPDLSTNIDDLNAIAIKQNAYPNPFSEQMVIEFELTESSILRLELSDITGRKVKLIIEDRLKAGKNRLTFNGAHLADGTYFLNAYQANNLIFSQQVIKQ